MKLNVFLVVATFSIFSINSISQLPYVEWSNSIEGYSAYGQSVGTDTLGNVYFAGMYSGTVDFDPGPSTLNYTSSNSNPGSYRDFYIQKLNANGDLLWVKTIPADVNFGIYYSQNPISLAVQKNGEVVVRGRFLSGLVDVDPGTGVFQVEDNFVIKLDAAGDLMWANDLPSENLQINNNNEVLLTGNFGDNVGLADTLDIDPGMGVVNLISDGNDSFILKLDSNGDFVWVKSIPSGTLSTACFFGDLTIDAADNLVLIGRLVGGLGGQIDMDSGPGVFNVSNLGAGSGGSSSVTLKLDTNGDFVFANVFGNSALTTDAQISVDNDLNIYISERFVDPIDVDPGAGVVMINSNGIYDVFLVKLGPTGLFGWVKTWGGSDNDIPFSLINDSNNNVIISGTFRDTVDFDPGVGQQIHVSTASLGSNVFLIEFDSSGNFLGGSAMHNVASVGVQSIGINNSDELFMTGSFNYGGGSGELHFNPGGVGHSLLATDYTDAFNVKFASCVGAVPVPDVVSLADISNECSVLEPILPTATHNCAGTIVGSPDVQFPISAPGTTVVTWTFDDGYGNTATQTQNIMITGGADVTVPVPDVLNLNPIITDCSSNPAAPTATDNCDGVLIGSPDVGLPISALGTSTVTWTYTDGSGNSTIQTQDVTIVADTIGPVPDVTNLPFVGQYCPITLAAPTAMDNCSGVITGTTSTTFPISLVGSTVVTWTFDDGNGNITTQTQNTEVWDFTNTVSANGTELNADFIGGTYQWLDCNDAYSEIPGEVNQTFNATDNGSYAVVVTIQVCIDTSDCFDLQGIGIDETPDQHVYLYPNPAHEQLRFINVSDEDEIRIYNIAGEMVLSAKVQNNQVEINSLAPGVYFIYFKESTTQKLKFVKL
jgi:Secretion system C-terminal sorting domain